LRAATCRFSAAEFFVQILQPLAHFLWAAAIAYVNLHALAVSLLFVRNSKRHDHEIR